MHSGPAYREYSYVGLWFGGQRCLAISNIACVPEIHDELVERLLDALKGVTLGDASDESVLMDPLFRPVLKVKLKAKSKIGLAEGATVLLEGRNPDMLRITKMVTLLDPLSSPISRPRCVFQKKKFLVQC
jgi:acyl-CoA reductase-like NAD-dependent aldehyde dehydrogenase